MSKMKVLGMMAVAAICFFSACKSEPKDPSQWTDEELNQWVSQKEYLGGLQIAPAAVTNMKALSESYFAHKDRWDSAFAYLKNTDLNAIEPGTYDVLNKDVYVIVPKPYFAKEADSVKYEAHRSYADIQYIVSGNEFMAELPLALTSELAPYDAEKDLVFVVPDSAAIAANPGAIVMNPADPSAFYVFFPDQAHKAGVKADSVEIKRVVVKVRLD